MAQRSGSGSRIASLLGLALLVAACGPIEYVGQVTRKASTAVTAAKAVDADKYSPYYYTLAVEYLHKARVKAASADFEAANRFGRKSEKAANMAKNRAIERAGKPLEEFFPNLRKKDGGLAPLVDEPQAAPVAPLTEPSEAPSDDAAAPDDSSGDDASGDDASGDDEELPPGLGGEL